jgi:hypothetical protein
LPATLARVPTVERAPLTRDAKLLLVGVASDALGTGLILPMIDVLTANAMRRWPSR